MNNNNNKSLVCALYSACNCFRINAFRVVCRLCYLLYASIYDVDGMKEKKKKKRTHTSPVKVWFSRVCLWLLLENKTKNSHTNAHTHSLHNAIYGEFCWLPLLCAVTRSKSIPRAALDSIQNHAQHHSECDWKWSGIEPNYGKYLCTDQDVGWWQILRINGLRISCNWYKWIKQQPRLNNNNCGR